MKELIVRPAPLVQVRLRPLLDPDIPEASAVFLTTLQDLARRNGLPPPGWSLAAMDPLFRHLMQTGDFRVAERDGRIVSICAALMRDQTWFLSLFWTLPEMQGQGIGSPLLRSVWEAGLERGARRGFTWSSIDPAAIGTYMRLGLLPLSQLFTFAGTVARPPDLPEDVTLEAATVEGLRLPDLEVRWDRRDADHAFWLDGGASAFLVCRDGRPVGYFYARDGGIGPGGWTEPDDGPAVMAAALREAARQAPTVRVMASGLNHTAIRSALGAGLRLAGTAHLLATEPIGAMDRYLPSGPALF